MKKLIWVTMILFVFLVTGCYTFAKIAESEGISFEEKMEGVLIRFTKSKNVSGHVELAKNPAVKEKLTVDTILQLPELPNGCEITALTSLLSFYQYKVSKTEMADKYLPKQPFYKMNSIVYGPNPFKAYAGNPRDRNGFFSYAPPIVEATNQYLAKVGGKERAKDITGSSREEIFAQIDNGTPIVIWITINLRPPKEGFSWYFYGTGQFFRAPVNVHTVVLTGYDDHNVFVMDPLKGQTTYHLDSFFKSYKSLGSHAMIIER